MSFKNDGAQVAEYVHSIADGDADTGTVILSTKDGKAALPVGAVVKSVTAKILVAYSGGTDLAWGNGNDADGYSGPTISTGSLTLNALFNGWDNAAALLWDDTNDHQIALNIPDATAGEVSVLMTGTHTVGKCVLLVEYYLPEGQG